MSGREFVEAQKEEVFGSFAVGDSIKPGRKRARNNVKTEATCTPLITAFIKCTLLYCFSVIRIRPVQSGSAVCKHHIYVTDDLHYSGIVGNVSEWQLFLFNLDTQSFISVHI